MSFLGLTATDSVDPAVRNLNLGNLLKHGIKKKYFDNLISQNVNTIYIFLNDFPYFMYVFSTFKRDTNETKSHKYIFLGYFCHFGTGYLFYNSGYLIICFQKCFCKDK